jgi:hypothetical protein
VFVDDSVTSDNAKKVFIPVIANIIEVKPEDSPFIDSGSNGEDIDLSTNNIKNTLRKIFNINKNKKVEDNLLKVIDALNVTAKKSLLSLQNTSGNPHINDPIIKNLYNECGEAFETVLDFLKIVLGEENIPYNIEGDNICGK